MGRNRKIGLDYFPFDICFFQDLKIRKLIKYQGGKAITVYALLLCNIYKEGYYMRWDEELPFIVSEQTGYEEVYIREVIKCCLVIGLFSKELFDSDKVLTSKGIQERYKEICSLSRRVINFSCYSLICSEKKSVSSEQKPISSEEKGITSEEMPINSVKSTQSKGKKSKIPPLSPPDVVEKSEDEEAQKESSLGEKLTLYCKKYGANNDDIKELRRLSNEGESGSRIWELFSWMDSHSGYSIVDVIKQMQDLEKQGKIICKSKVLFRIKEDLKPLVRTDEYVAIMQWKNNPDFGDTLRKLIDDVYKSKGRITMPGTYILKRLKSCLK